jgi:hypothetical protein
LASDVASGFSSFFAALASAGVSACVALAPSS